MDWLIDSTDVKAASGRARALLEDHLRRHAADPHRAAAVVGAARAGLDRGIEAAAGRPVRLSVDWTAPRPLLHLSVVDDVAAPARLGIPTGEPVPARHRSAVRGWPQRHVGTLELRLERRRRRTFDAGPPPVVAASLDLSPRGPGTVALALVAALEAHPSASPEQAATIAGALIASAGTDPQDRFDARRAADTFVRLHGALGSEAHVVAADEETVELAVSRCPFGDRGGGSALCHVSSGLAGQLAARVHGAATVVLDEAIVTGDPECHLQVALRRSRADDRERETYFWPPRAAAPAEHVPHLDLSVALPRESVSVPVVRRVAAQALLAFGVHDEDVDDVRLAISEACANVIEHAAETDTYDVKVELAADRCAITVVDRGGGFDATAVPRAQDDAEMGRGLALMRVLVDNVAFRNEPRAGAVVHMVKALSYDTSHPLRRR